MIPGFRELLHPLETPPFFGDCLQAQTRVAETAPNMDFLQVNNYEIAVKIFHIIHNLT